MQVWGHSHSTSLHVATVQQLLVSELGYGAEHCIRLQSVSSCWTTYFSSLASERLITVFLVSQLRAVNNNRLQINSVYSRAFIIAACERACVCVISQAHQIAVVWKRLFITAAHVDVYCLNWALWKAQSWICRMSTLQITEDTFLFCSLSRSFSSTAANLLSRPTTAIQLGHVIELWAEWWDVQTLQFVQSNSVSEDFSPWSINDTLFL